MKKLTTPLAACFSTLLFFNIAFLHAQNVSWALTGGQNGYQQVNGSYIAPDGSTFITGSTDPTQNATFGNFIIPYENGGYMHEKFLVAKANADGSWAWAKGGGGGYINKGWAVTADENGNCYATGFCDGIVVFEEDTLTALDYKFAHGVMVSYTLDGTLRWVKRFGERKEPDTQGDTYGTCALYLDGYIYTVGHAFGNAVFYGNLISSNTNNNNFLYLMKTDTAGNFVWVKKIAESITGNLTLEGRKLISNGNGNLLLTGFYDNAAIIKGDTLLNTPWYFSDTYQSFFMQINSSGNVLWHKNLNANDNQNFVNDLALGDDGSIYVSGIFLDTLEIGNQTFINTSQDFDAFVAKLDPLANPVWAKRLTGENANGYGYGIDVSSSGTVAACGFFIGTFNPDGCETFVPDAHSIYVSAFNEGGIPAYCYTLGGNSDEQLSGVGFDADDNLYINGIYHKNAAFGTTTISTTDELYYDIYIARINSSTTSVRNTGQHIIDVELFPNPAANTVNIQCTGIAMERIILSAANGAVMNTIFPKSADIIQINLNDLAPGIYFVEVTTALGRVTHRLMITPRD